MAEPEVAPTVAGNGSHSPNELYRQATRLNAKLASKHDPALASEGRRVAEALLAHVRSRVEDYEDFVRRVQRSEEFSLHESAQLSKGEKDLRVHYLRAVDLLETIREAEERAKKRAR